jgi:hypothetical protein
MAPLVPLLALSLAASGEIGPGEPVQPPARPASLSGRTRQSLPVALEIDPGARSAGWRIAYDGRCSDGGSARGRSSSGEGTPRLRLNSDGAFALEHSEPTAVVRGGSGTIRFTLRGRARGRSAAGTWSATVTLRRPGAAPVTCTTGPLAWRASER